MSLWQSGRGSKPFKWLPSLPSVVFLLCSASMRGCSSGPCPQPTSFLTLTSSPCTIPFTPVASTSVFSLMNPQSLLQVSKRGPARDLSCKPQRLTEQKRELSKRYCVALRIVGKLKNKTQKMDWEKGRPKLSHISPGRSLPPEAMDTAVCILSGVLWKMVLSPSPEWILHCRCFFESLDPNSQS